MTCQSLLFLHRKKIAGQSKLFLLRRLTGYMRTMTVNCNNQLLTFRLLYCIFLLKLYTLINVSIDVSSVDLVMVLWEQSDLHPHFVSKRLKENHRHMFWLRNKKSKKIIFNYSLISKRSGKHV